MNRAFENNNVTVEGKIISDFTFNHEIFGEKFYMMDVEVQRLSDTSDIIPVMISERLINVEEDYKERLIYVNGHFRSFNRHEENKTRLILSVFAKEVEFIEHAEDSAKSNQIYLDGFICKEPIYRKTPLGREIADLLIAVNRPYGKSDYIPCICWGRNARFVSGLKQGKRISVQGRIQSREYMKRIDEETTVKRLAYEVSVSTIKFVEEITNEEESN